MRVLVTGGAGFIGANVCRALLASPEGHEVVVLDDLSSGFAENLEGVDVTMLEGTVLDPDLAEQAAVGADAVVHLAGRGSVPRSIADPVASWEANATGTLNVLQAARRAGGLHVVVASSSSVYGANPTLPKEEHLVPLPVSPYAASKLAAEGLALAFQHSYQLPVLAFRFFNVFGPWQRPRHDYAAVVPAFVSAALAGEALPVHGDGKQSRDFTFVDTLTSVVVSAVEQGVVHPEPVNLAFGARTDLLSLVAELEEVVGRPLEVQHLPDRPGDVRHTEADASRLRSLFPDVEPVGLEEGLRATVDWYRANGVV